MAGYGDKYLHKKSMSRSTPIDIKPDIYGSLVAYPQREVITITYTTRGPTIPTGTTGAMGTWCGEEGYIDSINSEWLYDKRMPDNGGSVIETTLTMRLDITDVV